MATILSMWLLMGNAVELVCLGSLTSRIQLCCMRETMTTKVVRMLDAKGAGAYWATSYGLIGPLVVCRLNS